MNIAYCFTGSFCTFDKSIESLKNLKKAGHNIIPVMSFNAYNTDTRFGTAEKFRNIIKAVCSHDIIHTIEDAEPIGPKNLVDIVAVAPCTSNTLAKLAFGINDTPVTMAVKSHLRNNKPVVIGVSTNDALGAGAKSIGLLMNMRNIYFVPMAMDDPIKKPRSMVCDFSRIGETLESAYKNEQIQIL